MPASKVIPHRPALELEVNQQIKAAALWHCAHTLVNMAKGERKREREGGREREKGRERVSDFYVMFMNRQTSIMLERKGGRERVSDESLFFEWTKRLLSTAYPVSIQTVECITYYAIAMCRGTRLWPLESFMPWKLIEMQ